MRLIICPGIHPPHLTASFLRALPDIPPYWIFPADRPVYSGYHILTWLLQQDRPFSQSTCWIGFSAGVVGAITAALAFSALGGQVQALIAIDGWGVPLLAPFPIHRLSHDRFTHWSSALLGAGESQFFADPAVAHLELWANPQHVRGWRTQADQTCTLLHHTPTTAACFLNELLRTNS
ncbi:MAG: hypothetical protein MUF72_21530 [Elainella sp. Prado103]|jgi:hypothetical protein|nr:hypothetical protein [Elainella sp. Prado103]